MLCCTWDQVNIHINYIVHTVIKQVYIILSVYFATVNILLLISSLKYSFEIQHGVEGLQLVISNPQPPPPPFFKAALEVVP